ELLRAFLLGAAGNIKIVNGRHQAALAFDELVLLLLDLTNIGADRNGAAIARLDLGHLQPAAIGKLALMRNRAGRVAHGRQATFGADRVHARLDVLAAHARLHLGRIKPRILLILGVAHDQAIGRIPEYEGFSDVLDRHAQALVSRLVTLGE